ncbi:hypothetical protein BDZ45DRAFT_738780 [Acephala macrosclerotiorum]|nr:hypothetical protein BDZ45DRAFT_738780 [Acephala macrosclerotiorum]
MTTKVQKPYNENSTAAIPYMPPEIFSRIIELLLQEPDFCTAICLGLTSKNMYELFLELFSRLFLVPNGQNNFAESKKCLQKALPIAARRKLTREERMSRQFPLAWTGPPLWCLLQDWMTLDHTYNEKRKVFVRRSTLDKFLGRKEKKSRPDSYLTGSGLLPGRYRLYRIRETNYFCDGPWSSRYELKRFHNEPSGSDTASLCVEIIWGAERREQVAEARRVVASANNPYSIQCSSH